jgi:alkylglycerol monooxygenase
VYKIENVYRFEKYDSKSSPFFIAWSWVQLTILLLLLSYFFGNISAIGSPGIFLYGGFIFLYVYAFTELMSLQPQAWFWELAKAAYGVGIIYYQRDWFGINQFFQSFDFIFIGYFLLSTGLSFYFLLQEKIKEEAKPSQFA